MFPPRGSPYFPLTTHHTNPIIATQKGFYESNIDALVS